MGLGGLGFRAEGSGLTTSDLGISAEIGNQRQLEVPSSLHAFFYWDPFRPWFFYIAQNPKNALAMQHLY